MLHPSLQEPIELVVFDAYGTLFDVQAAVRRIRDDIGPDWEKLAAHWRMKQLEYSWTLSLMGRYETFWTLTERALDHALRSYPAIDPALRPRLLGAYRVLDAYAEARDVLVAIRQAGLRCCILSNGDPAMLEAAVGSASLSNLLDAVLSVDPIKVFKTHPRAYEIVGHRFGVAPQCTCLVSSNAWDAAGAAAFGFRSVWINRNGQAEEYPDLKPYAVLRDLAALAEV